MNIWRKFYIRKSSDFSYNCPQALLLISLFIGLLILTGVASIFFGATHTSVKEAIEALHKGQMSSAAYRIIFYVRIPRVLAAMLSGSALAVAGVIIQAVLNNAMAAPNIIGINAGAGLASLGMIALAPSALSWMPLASFLGAMAAFLCIYAIAAKTGASRMTITLVGIAISSILTAGMNTIKTIFPDSIYNANSFLVGGFAGVGYQNLHPAYIMILLGLLMSFFLAKDMDVLSLGEQTAFSLGMQVKRLRFCLLMVASLLAGCAVSFAGLLGFVGLVVPHIMRRIVGSEHRLLLPMSALGGAVLVVLCDLISRVIFAPYEIPVGIILSFIGGPFFIALILMQRKGRLYD